MITNEQLQLMKKYAHDYRDMKMNEAEGQLLLMLNHYTIELDK